MTDETKGSRYPLRRDVLRTGAVGALGIASTGISSAQEDSTPAAPDDADIPVVDNSAGTDGETVSVLVTVVDQRGDPVSGETVRLEDRGGTPDNRSGETGPGGRLRFLENVGPRPCNDLTLKLPDRGAAADIGCHNGGTDLEHTFDVSEGHEDGTAREFAEQFAPNIQFDEFQPWFPTAFEQYENEGRFDDRTVVDGFQALDGYVSEYKDKGRPPYPTVYYNVVGVTDPDAPLEENDLVDVQFWMYYAFDQFTVNFHWHDMEHVHFFVDTESMEPVLIVGSAHADNAVNNEYLAGDGEVSMPANILPELGSHASATDLNEQRGSFERYGTSSGIDPDVTNGTDYERASDLVHRLRYWELDADLETAVNLAFQAYGLPRRESDAPLDLTGIGYRIPELNGDPVYEHADLPNVGESDLISRVPGGLPGALLGGVDSLDETDGLMETVIGELGPSDVLDELRAQSRVRFSYGGSRSSNPYDYDLAPLDPPDDRDGYGFWGPDLAFRVPEPGLATDYTRGFTTSVADYWEKDAYLDPTEVIDHIPHKEHLEDEYGLDLLTPVEQQVWALVLDVREWVEQQVDETWEEVEEFLDDLTEYPEPVRAALQDLETELDAYRNATAAEIEEAYGRVEDELENVGQAISEVDDVDAESLADGLESVGDAVEQTSRSRLSSFQPDVDGVVDDGEDFIEEYAPDIDFNPPSVSDVENGATGIIEGGKDAIGLSSGARSLDASEMQIEKASTHATDTTTSEAEVVPSSNGVIAMQGLEPGTYRLLVEADGMAPYAVYFTVEAGETRSVGGAGACCLVPEEQAVKVAGKSETDELAGVAIEEDFAGNIYESEVKPDGSFAAYVPRSGMYSVEVRDTDDETATYRVDPDEDTDVVRFDDVQTGEDQAPAPAFAWPDLTLDPDSLAVDPADDPLVAYLTFDRPVDLAAFDPGTVDLDGVEAISDESHDLVAEPIVERDGEEALAVLFERAAVVDALGQGTHDVRVTGAVGDTVVRGGAELTIQGPSCNGSKAEGVEELTDGQTVCDVDGDGEYRDVSGDGSVTNTDVTEFFANQHADPWDSRADLFDFTGDGEVTQADVIDLFEYVASGSS